MEHLNILKTLKTPNTPKTPKTPKGTETEFLVKKQDKNVIAEKMGNLRRLKSDMEFGEGETLIHEWGFEVVILNKKDKLFTLLTCGLYACIMKMVRKTRRHMRLFLTDSRILVKEEMMNTMGPLKEEIWEAQQSFVLNQLTYMRMETGLGGILEPAYFYLDLHFLEYPSEVEPTMYASWGSQFFRPFVDAIFEGLDRASGGVYTQLKAAQKNSDPWAMLEATASALSFAKDLAENPGLFFIHFLIEFTTICFERFTAWVDYNWNLMKQVLWGLVPIAEMPRKFYSVRDGGEPANMVRLKLYQPDDLQFLENAEAFMRSLVKMSSKLKHEKNRAYSAPMVCPHVRASADFSNVQNIVQKDKSLILPSFLYGFTENSDMLFLAPMEWTMTRVHLLYCILSFGTYYITDLQGILQHTGSLMLTSDSLITTTLKVRRWGKGIDHARVDCWFLQLVATHSLDTKKNQLNDKQVTLSISSMKHGSIVLDVSDVKKSVCNQLRKHLSVAMPRDVQLSLPEGSMSMDQTIQETKGNFTSEMLSEDEYFVSMWKDRNKSILAKILSLGFAEHSSFVTVFTRYRVIFRMVASNCRGKRKVFEVSVPLMVIHGVFWSNFYQRTNKVFKFFKMLCPCCRCCLLCCLFCPLSEDKTAHFWMGQPGVQVRILAGRTTTFGMVMTGKMIWYCASEDAVRTSIQNLLSLQLGTAQSQAQQDVHAGILEKQKASSPELILMIKSMRIGSGKETVDSPRDFEILPQSNESPFEMCNNPLFPAQQQPARLAIADNSKATNTRLKNFTVAEVVDFVQALGLPHNHFQDCEIDGKLLVELTDEELKGEMSLTPFQAKKLKAQIQVALSSAVPEDAFVVTIPVDPQPPTVVVEVNPASSNVKSTIADNHASKTVIVFEPKSNVDTSTPIVGMIQNFSVAQVCKHVEALGLPSEQFYLQSIDGKFLSEITDKGLAEKLKLKPLHIKKLRASIM